MADDHFAEEIRSHVAHEADRLIASGVDPAEAYAAARRRFGNVTQVAEVRRESRPIGFDVNRLRLAVRRLVRAPVFSIAVILMLGVTLATVTLVLTTIYMFKWRVLPMPDPAAIEQVWINANTHAAAPVQDVVTGDVLRTWRDRQHSFSELAAFYTIRVRTGDLSIRIVAATIVDGQYFQVLGFRPALGRIILPSDDQTGTPPVAVLSDAEWRNRFHADSAVLGTAWRLNGQAYTVVGVAPKAANIFATPAWISAPDREAWPLAAGYQVLGRLRPDVSPAHASAELATLLPRPVTPDATPRGVFLIPLTDVLRGLPATTVLFAGATLLMIIVALANIGTLFLVRRVASIRQRAISIAIGATAGRLRIDAALEGVILGIVAGAVAIIIAAWLRIALHGFIATSVLSSAEVLPLPGHVMGMILGAALTTGAAIAIASAETSRRMDIAACLHGADTGATTRQSRWRLLLVSLQVAVALVAGVAAVRLVAVTRYLSHLDLGYETDHLLVAQLPIWSTPLGSDSAAQRLVNRITPIIAATPGLGDPAVWATIGFRLAQGRDDILLAIDGRTDNVAANCRSSTCPTGFYPVSDNLFGVLGIALRRGRTFTSADRGGAPVVILNEQAQRVWFGGDAVGRRLQMRGTNEPDVWRTVVGVVSNAAPLNDMARVAKHHDSRVVAPQIYVPLAQAHLHQAYERPNLPLFVAVRPRLGMAAASQGLRSALAGLLPDEISPTISSMTAVADQGFAESRVRLNAGVVVCAATLTLLLTVIGLTGAVAETGRHRRREIGIRLALGSSQSALMRIVCHSAIRMTAMGLTVGMIVTVAMKRAIAAAAFGGSSDASPQGWLLLGPDLTTPTLVIGALMIVVVCILAAAIPGWRASRLDPATVLRQGQ